MTVAFDAEEQSALQRSPSQQCRHTPGKSRFRPTTGPVKWGRQPYIQQLCQNIRSTTKYKSKFQNSAEIQNHKITKSIYVTISDSHLEVKYFFPNIVFSCMKHFYKHKNKALYIWQHLYNFLGALETLISKSSRIITSCTSVIKIPVLVGFLIAHNHKFLNITYLVKIAWNDSMAVCRIGHILTIKTNRSSCIRIFLRKCFNVNCKLLHVVYNNN